jgi:hypothetical protein
VNAGRTLPPPPLEEEVRVQDVRLGTAFEATAQTFPCAVCRLTPADAVGKTPSLEFFADDDGLVRFVLKPTPAAAAHAELTLACTTKGGSLHTQTVRWEAAPAGVRFTIVGPRLRARSKAIERSLPALSSDEMALDEDELLRRGYPIRPDPDQAPALHAAWRRMVSRPLTIVRPTLVGGEEPHFNNFTMPTWSGYFLLAGQNAPLTDVYGEWIVPTVSSESGFWRIDASSLWVGLDGNLLPRDIIQAGTEQDTQTVFGVQASSYFAWSEYFPDPRQTISNIPVQPGDKMFVWAEATDQPSLGANGAFFVWNETRGQLTEFSVPAPNGTSFHGSEAEWILELPDEPLVSGLADYGRAVVGNAQALDYGGQVSLAVQRGIGIDMVSLDNGHVLSRASGFSLDSFALTFVQAR